MSFYIKPHNTGFPDIKLHSIICQPRTSKLQLMIQFSTGVLPEQIGVMSSAYCNNTPSEGNNLEIVRHLRHCLEEYPLH